MCDAWLVLADTRAGWLAEIRAGWLAAKSRGWLAAKSRVAGGDRMNFAGIAAGASR